MSNRKRKARLAPKTAAPVEPRGFFDFDPEAAERLGGFFRRIALGLTVALVAARAYFPSDGARTELETGRGLVWVFALLVAAGFAIVGFWISGKTRLRWSIADFGLIALVSLVCLSSTWALEKRIALNLAWEWAGLGLAYFLLRTLPASRSESSSIAGVLVATAVAVSAYGLYQVAVEYPAIRADYLKNPVRMAQEVGIDPSDQAGLAGFENRVLGSKEPMSTFALTNSLAGYLAAATALSLAVVVSGARIVGLRRLVMAAIPLVVMMACLLLTKSRSAYLGLGVAGLILAWRLRRAMPAKTLVIGGAAIAGILAILIGAASALKQLDLQVLTESSKSLGVRGEYWRGTWGVVNESRNAYWFGYGPGNFAAPYLRHKLPEAGEEILDPHDFLLELWSIAGLPALLASLWALGFGLKDIFGRSRGETGEPRPERSFWIIASGGIGGLLIVVPLGLLDPLRQGDLIPRWLVLAGGWSLAIGLGSAIWRRTEIPAIGAGLAVVALAVNLLAAGGIGVPSVALMLWSMLAIGLNLRDDRPCGRVRLDGGRWLAFALAVILSMALGTFAGQVGLYWRAEAKLAEADRLLGRRPPDFDAAQNAYIEATKFDPLMITPWISLADSTFVAWRDLKTVPGDAAWQQMRHDLDLAETPPRNSRNLTVERRRATYASAILARGEVTSRVQTEALLKARADACAAAVRLYPTSPSLRADLSDALSARNQFTEAAAAARTALDLDRTMPHASKKLPADVRKRLEASIPQWEGRKPTRK